MVVICSDTFSEEGYQTEFDLFPGFELSPFQKWAVKAIADGDHSLITAHTGSGKTLPAEYAILRAARQGKRVIYTAPIKALSNTKLSDLRAKYPDISFGLITGDITDNPEAQVLIMTTEVLPNTICNMQARKTRAVDDVSPLPPLSFEMDVDNDLQVVVFDEVHYINDEERGGAWEQAILLLPPHVQLVMLSATIDRPEVFADWVESAKRRQARKSGLPEKKLYLSSTKIRSVPLTHRVWFSCNARAMTLSKTKDAVAGLVDSDLVLQAPGMAFDEKLYHRVARGTKLVAESRCTLRRGGVLDSLLSHLRRTQRLPAICFVFSRRQVECCAREVSCALHSEEDAQLVASIEGECRRILATRLPNYREYLELPEYLQLMSMLKKGVAIHHAGVLPVFREMIEMLFDKKMIKVLFATETLAVGVNFSTASVIFTSLSKFDGTTHRPLLAHEYTQMAGRAGRRGIDKEGHVWICASLCNLDQLRAPTCRTILGGVPPTLTSKFKIGLGMVLSLGAGGQGDILDNTLLGRDMARLADQEAIRAANLKKKAEAARDSLKWARTPLDALTAYGDAKSALKGARKRARQRLLRQLEEAEAEHHFIKDDYETMLGAGDADAVATACAQEADAPLRVLPALIEGTMDLLRTEGFMTPGGDLTRMGKIASQIREAHPLAITKLLTDTEIAKGLTPAQLAAILSVQCGFSVQPDSESTVLAQSGDRVVNEAAKNYGRALLHFESEERKRGLQSGEQCEHQYALLGPILAWCAAEDADACKMVLAGRNYDGAELGTGAFVKAVLKICNIAAELGKGAEATGDLWLKEKTAAIPGLLLKYVATAQSLYV